MCTHKLLYILVPDVKVCTFLTVNVYFIFMCMYIHILCLYLLLSYLLLCIVCTFEGLMLCIISYVVGPVIEQRDL